MTNLILANAAEKAGWNSESQIEVLLEFIEFHNIDAKLEDFLNKKISEEQEMGNDSNS